MFAEKFLFAEELEDSVTVNVGRDKKAQLSAVIHKIVISVFEQCHSYVGQW